MSVSQCASPGAVSSQLVGRTDHHQPAATAEALSHVVHPRRELRVGQLGAVRGDHGEPVAEGGERAGEGDVP
jgi:hypothetical protein